METIENTLLRLLRLAWSEPDCWPLFYRVLKSMQVYVVGKVNGPYREYVPLSPDSTISLTLMESPDGAVWIPFFSSAETMQASLDMAQPYFTMPALMLLEKTRGANLVLDPASESKKEFLPEEVDRILDSRYKSTGDSQAFQENTQVIVGKPEAYPSALVDALTTLFIESPAVVSASFCTTQDISHDESATLVIGIQIDRPAPSLIDTTYNIIAETRLPGETVSLGVFACADVKSGSLEHHLFSQCEPFYQRSWGSQLRDFYGVGHA